MTLTGKLFIRENMIEDSHTREYVIKTVLPDVDKDSEFDMNNAELIKQTAGNPQEYMAQLASQGYDALIGYEGREIIGHMVFQEHREEGHRNWQMFRVYVIPEMRGKGYPVLLSESLLKKASEYNISQVRLGGGKNPVMKRIVERIPLKNYIQKVDLDSLWITLRQQ